MPLRDQMNIEIASEATKSAPPVVVTLGALVSGLTINHVVGFVTLFYVVLQAGYLIWKWRRDVKRERERGECRQ